MSTAIHERSFGEDYSRWQARPDQYGDYTLTLKPEEVIAKRIGERYPYYIDPKQSKKIGIDSLPNNGQSWWFADAVRIGIVFPLDLKRTDFRELGTVVDKVRGDAASLVYQGGNLRSGLTILAGGDKKPTLYRGQMAIGSNKDITAFFSKDENFPDPLDSNETSTLVLVHTLAWGQAQTKSALSKFAEMGYEQRQGNGKLRRGR